MRPSEQKQLLKDIIAERDLSQLSEITLQSGLMALRGHRRRRHARRILVFAGLPLVLGFAALIGLSIRHPTLARKVPKSLATMQPQNSGVKIINDDELFALFPNRSLALVGKPGQQELVFLDRGRSAVISTP